jgi:hypothetical protein
METVVGDFSTEGLVAHPQNLELLDIVDKEFAGGPGICGTLWAACVWSSMATVSNVGQYRYASNIIFHTYPKKKCMQFAQIKLETGTGERACRWGAVWGKEVSLEEPGDPWG